MDIANEVSKCHECQERQPKQQKETLMRDPLPSYPFQEVASDLFQHGKGHYLIYVDRLSGWPCVERLNSTTSAAVIKKLTQHFVDWNIPMKLRSDGGPQYTSRETQSFLKEWDVEHQVSSPKFPQSNGL